MSLNNIPEELRQRPQWCWSSLVVNMATGKADKAPRQPGTRHLASVTDPNTWATFDECAAMVAQHGGAVGYVLAASDPYCIIDLDSPLSPEDADNARKVLQAVDYTYTETSQSGHGIHIVGKANIEGGYRRRNIEIYDRERYIVFTGNLFPDRPTGIEAMQGHAQEIVASMERVMDSKGLPPDAPEERTDDEIWKALTGASNAQKFLALFNYEPGPGDDWSTLDARLAQFIAYHTRNHEQALRIFRHSKLYRGTKGGYNTVDKYERDYLLRQTFGTQWAHLARERAADQRLVEHGADIAAHILGQWKQNQQAALQAIMDRTPPPPPPTQAHVPEGSIPCPPGLVGEVAAYIYETTPSPVWEIAIAHSIVFCSAVLGNKWLTSTGSGLGHYVVLLADSGTGKSAAGSRLEALAHAVEDQGNMLMSNLAGPGAFSSGQAMVKRLAEQPVFYSLLTEFDATLKRMHDNKAADYIIEFRRVMLDLFDRASIRPSVYANKKDNVDAVRHPVVSWLGDTRAEDFFGLVDEQFARSGFLPRLTLIEYAGSIPPLRAKPGIVPDTLVQRVGSAVLACSRDANGTAPAPMDPAAALYFTELQEEQRRAMNAIKGDEVTRSSWNRFALRIQRLATVVATGENWVQPMVTVAHMQWAEGIVRWGLERVLHSRLQAGAIGDGDARMDSDIADAVARYASLSPAQRVASFDVPKALAQHDNLYPYPFFKALFRNRQRFNTHRLGLARAVQLALDEAVKLDQLVLVEPEALKEQLGYKGRTPVYGLSGER